MPKPTELRQNFAIRPLITNGVWESNDHRYRNYAHEQLAELERTCVEINSQWPSSKDEVLKEDHPQYEQLSKLVHLRDRNADSVQIYSAMAVEGFLNWYGVARLGERIFNDHFERLGVIPKLRVLLLTCESIDVAKTDPIIVALDDVAKCRNALVHPKAKEVVGDPALHRRTGKRVPEVPQRIVSNMEAIFSEFARIVPDAEGYLKR